MMRSNLYDLLALVSPELNYILAIALKSVIGRYYFKIGKFQSLVKECSHSFLDLRAIGQ